MEQYDLAAIIASSGENVSYLSDIPRLPAVMDTIDICVVAFRDQRKEAAIIIPTVAADQYAQSDSKIKEVRTYNPFFYYKSENADLSKLSEAERRIAKIYFKQHFAASIAQSLFSLLKSRDILHGKVGYEKNTSAAKEIRTITKKAPHLTLKSCEKLFQLARLVKTKEEIERIRTAVSATEDGIQAVLDFAKPGVENRELQYVFQTTVMKRDCTVLFAAIAAGTEGALVNHLPSKYKLQKGDVVRMDCNVLYKNYVSDVGRNAVLGVADSKSKRIFGALLAGVEKMTEIAKPGIRVAELFRAGISTTRSSGLLTYQRQHIGHSLGIQVVEPPLISPDFDTELQENMIIAIESPYYEIGFGSFNPEDTVLITRSGSSKLTQTTNQLYSI